MIRKLFFPRNISKVAIYLPFCFIASKTLSYRLGIFPPYESRWKNEFISHNRDGNADTFSQSSLQLKVGRDCGLYWLDALPTTATPTPTTHTSAAVVGSGRKSLAVMQVPGTRFWCDRGCPSSGSPQAPEPSARSCTGAACSSSVPLLLCLLIPGCTPRREEWVPSSCRPQAFW